MFTKSDLQVNDWCVFSDGSIYRAAWLNGGLVLIGEDQWGDLDSYKDNLTHNDDFDLNIDKVYRPNSFYSYQLIRCYYKCGDLIFDREKGISCEPSVKEISVEEATKLLTDKFGQNVRIRVSE